MESKFFTMCKIERHINNFNKNVQNVKFAIAKDA